MQEKRRDSRKHQFPIFESKSGYDSSARGVPIPACVWTRRGIRPVCSSAGSAGGGVMDALLDDRRVDPFKDWLEARPPWDGEDRLDFWLGHSVTVGDIHEDRLSWASRSVLMGVVTRTDHPVEKHDEMVVPGRAPGDRDVHGLGVAVAPRAAAVAVVF